MRTIDLDGPDGNAFVLMAIAHRWSRQLDKDGDAILLDMQSGDYEHVIEVFEREFGHLCRLKNKPAKKTG